MIFDTFIFFCTDVQFQIDLMFLILVNHVLIKRFFVHIVWNSMVYKFNFVTLYLLLCIIVIGAKRAGKVGVQNENSRLI